LNQASKQSVVAILKKIRGRIGFFPLYNLMDSHRLAEQNIAQNRGFNDKISVQSASHEQAIVDMN